MMNRSLGVFVVCGLLCVGAIGMAGAQTPPSGAPAEAQPPPPQREVVVPAPEIQRPQARPADPRSMEQRQRDRRSFERCLLRAQSRESEDQHYNPLRPDPAEICRQRTGMWDQNDVPQKR